MLQAWLDSWAGAGHVVGAMPDLGYDARLCQSPFGWRAEFCRTQVNPLPPGSGRPPTLRSGAPFSGPH